MSLELLEISAADNIENAAASPLSHSVGCSPDSPELRLVMAFGFPAFHKERFIPENSNCDLRRAVLESLGALGWVLRVHTNDSITASIKVSFLSWGERLSVDFHPDNSCSTTSKCSFPTQCIDWGKNSANVQKLIAQLYHRVSHVIPDHSQHQQ